MANKFNLTAELNLRGPTNIRTVVADIRRQLGTINADVRINVNPAATRNINSITQRLTAMNSVLVTARNNTDSLNASLRNLTGTIQSVNSVNTRTVTTTSQTATSMASAAKSAQMATSAMQEFGKQSALAIKRFAAFSFVTTGIYALINAVNQGVTAFINYDKQLVRLQQITGQTRSQLSSLDKTITQLATSFGISSESLIGIADTLAQAGLTAEETRVALTALAKTELAPSFDDISRTTEGAIAALRQFSLEASDLEAALGSINAVSARFAVESGDIIAAIQRTGGVFAAASKGVSQGKDALNEFIAVFTSVRATTRESAETIATGLRTIFTRIQRAGTIKQLRDFGVELQDLEGKFVGPFEAVRRLSEALNQLDPRDIRFSTIVEELGGFRQIGKVIPLIQQFATAQEALKVAQTGQASLSGAQVKSQQALQIQIAKVREEFLALVRDIGQSSSFQALAKIILGLASTFIKLVSAFKPVLPILAIIGAIKGASAITKFAGGFFGAFKKGGGAGSAGTSIGERLTGTTERERTEVTARASELTRENTNALVSLTSAVERLSSLIRSRGPTTLASGGKVLGFNRGGVVPGTGKGDSVPALLEPGEVVMSNNAVNKYGRGNLVRMNKYAGGGYVKKKLPRAEQAIKQTSLSYNDIDSLKIDNPGKGAIRGYLFENYVAKKYGIPAPGKEFPDIKNIKNKKREFGLTKQETGKDIIAAELKYRSGIEIKEWNDQFNRDNTAVLYAIDKKNGGLISKFMAGSRGGVDWKNLSKGRGKAGARGARDIVEPISTETYLKWAKGIYEEYDADPSLVMAIGPGGERLPPEIALANKLLAQYAFETGGAGLAVGKRFVRTPKANITDELRPYLVPDPSDPNEFGFFQDDIRKFGRAQVLSKAATSQLGKQSALEAAAARNAAYTNAESAISSFKQTGVLDVDPSIMRYIQRSMSNPDSLPLEPKDLDKLKKKLTKPNLDAFSALVGPSKTPVGVQGQRTKLSEVFGKILETYGSETSDLEIDNIIRGIGSKIQNKKFGGIIQKFQEGSEGSVQPLEELLSGQELYDWIQSLGGAQTVRGLVGGQDVINQKISEVLGAPPITYKQIFDKKFLLGPNSEPYLRTAQDLLTVADANKKKPRIFTDDEKAKAIRVGFVGMLPFGVDQLLYEQIGDKIVGIQMKSLTKDKAIIVDQMRRDIDTVLGKGTQALYGDPGKELDDLTKEALGLGNLEGYMIEAILARAGANPGKLNDRSVDYASGLGSAASLFGIDPNIPTEVKRDVKGGLSKARANFRNYFAKLAFGGQVNGPQTPKNFGQVALRTGNRIQATYIKEGEAAASRSGQVIADNIGGGLYAVQSSSATKGYGPKLYDIVMEAATAAGGMLTSDRRTVSDAAKAVWSYYFNNRSDVKKTPLSPENWVSNSRLLDEKLYGPPDTWPPATDPAWTLQTGYTKSPYDINNPELVQRLATGGKSNTIPAMVSNGEAFVPPKVAKRIGYAKLDRMNQADRNGMRKYAGGGGISVFKGPGSGTSDSIGPIGLPQGSYVIREKATKALGLKRGGGVGIQNFVAGGSPSGFSMPPMPIGLEDIRGIKEEILNNYKKLYADEKKRIDELYDSLEAQARADFMSGALSLDELQDNLETLLQARILAKRQTKETLTAQTQTAQTQASAEYRSDPFYMAKKAADEYAESVGKAAETSKQMAEEQKAYIEYIAREKGLSSKGLQRQLTKDVARESYQVKARSRFGQEELKAIAAGSSRTLRGKDVTSLLQTDTQEGRQIQDIVNAFEAKLKEINPSMENAREEAEKLAVGLSQGDQSVQQYIASNDTLNTLLNTQISDTDAYNEAVRRAAAAAGISEEALRSLASEAEVARREFAETPEGKRYGVLAEIAPDMTKKFSQSGLGKGLGKIEDFFSGKGGTLSKLAGRAGGLTGLATAATAAIPFAAESLFTKEQMKDPNVAGGISAVTGATSMAAAGFELAGGGIPGIIAAGAGLLLGGIKGWFEGKNQAVFTNAIENLAKTTNTLETAFKELEKEATPKNIEKFNKAAGDAFMAQQDVANIAFSEQRNALGSATSGEALTGAALGAAIGTAIAPGIGTAIGAGIGYLAGAFTDYYSKFDPQQIAEAGGAYVNAAVSQYEMQTRAAEIKTEQLPIAEIDAMMKALNDGVKGAGPTVKSYADALRSTGKYTEDQIATMSDEESAIAAFLQTRKAQLGSEEAAIEELKKNKNASIEIGRQLRDEADKRMLKDKLLKDAIKEVAVATESLLDIYRRLGANIQRFEAELGDVSNNIKGYLGDLSGSTEIQSVDRSGSERILGNISAYTAEEVRGAASSVSAMLGNTPESQQLADTASAAKILTDELPALLRANQGDRGAAVDQLEELFAAQGLDSGAIDAVLEEIRNKISQDEGKDIGTLIQDIDQGIISKFSEQASEGAKKLQELAATYNNTIQEFINLQNQQNQAILKANEYYRQAAQIRLNAELDLAKALGRNLSLEELNKPFETEIGNLTQGLMNIGVLGADQAMDPAAIAAGIQEAANRNLAIEASQKELGASFGEGTDAGQRQALNQAQLDNIQALGENKRAIEEGRAALEKLANDGSRAANALAKIQEEQKRLEAYGSSIDKALTGSPEDLIKMNFNTDAINRVLAGDTRGLKTSSGRRAAYAGLEQDRGLIGEAEYNKRLAVLRRQSLMAVQGGQITPQQEEAIARLEKGLPDEEDPNVKAYREAVAVQEEAARKLGDLQMASADKIGTAMDDLRTFLQDKFPDLLAKAVADAQAASAGAAEAGKPKEPTPEAKAEQKRREEADKSAEMRQKEIDKAEREWKTKSDQAARLDREATASERYRADPVGRGLANNAAEQEAEAAARLNRLKAEDEAAKQAEQQKRASFDAARKQEEQKAKEAKSAEEARKASENRAKTEDAIDRATRAQQGGGTIPPPLPAPPAPGTAQATYTGTRAAAGAVVRPAQYAGVSGPIDTFAQARRNQEIAERGQALQGLGLSKTSKEEELAKKERALKAASIAAAGAGTLETSPNVLSAQKAVDMAKQDLISINEQITAEKQRLAALAQQAKLEEQGQTAPVPVSMSPQAQAGAAEATRRLTGGPLDNRDANRSAFNASNPNQYSVYGAQPSANTIDQGSRRIVANQTAPVPVTQPTRTQTNTPAPSGPSGGMGYALTIDDKSVQFLNNLTDTFNKFGTYVDKLAGLDLTVEFAGNVTVDVNITGAAGLAALDKTMRDLATSLVEAKVSELRDELATVTRGAVRPSAARGSVSP